MTAIDILKQQQAWLDRLQKSLEDPTPALLTALLATREQQMAEVQSRIDDLTRQKESAIARFDAAIDTQLKALTTLQTATANTGPILPTPTPTPPASRRGARRRKPS